MAMEENQEGETPANMSEKVNSVEGQWRLTY